MQKWGPKRGYNGKYYMETPNSVEPFFNVEEGLKTSNFVVYIEAQKYMQLWLRYEPRKC